MDEVVAVATPHPADGDQVVDGVFSPATHALSVPSIANVMQRPLLAQPLPADPAVLRISLIYCGAQGLRDGQGFLAGLAVLVTSHDTNTGLTCKS